MREKSSVGISGSMMVVMRALELKKSLLPYPDQSCEGKNGRDDGS